MLKQPGAAQTVSVTASEPRMTMSRYVVLALLCLLAPVVHLWSVGPQVPEGTFFLISQLGDPALRNDPSNLIYSFARSPVYVLMGWTFAYPLAFLAIGVLAHAGFNATVFALVHHAIARDREGASGPIGFALSLALTFLVFPAAVVTGLTGHGLTLVPHDAYDAFSMRTPFWIAVGLGHLLWLKDRRRAALWMIGASCWIHPSAGILAFGLVTLASAAALARERRPALLLHWIGAALLGAAPTLTRLLMVGLPIASSADVGYAEWYSSMIKDEADDFSFLFQLLYRTVPFVVITGLIVFTLVVHSWIFPSSRRDSSFRSAAAIPVLFFLGVAVEWVLAVWIPTPLIAVLISLTPGYRLLSFAFFPLLVLGARLANAAVAALEERASEATTASVAPIAVSVVLAFAWLGPLGLGWAAGRTSASFEVASWALGSGRVPGLDAYMEASARAGQSSFWTPQLFELDGPIIRYPGERSLLRIRALDREQPSRRLDLSAMERIREADFLELVRTIRRELPTGSGLIIPPYMRHFRDSLPDYRFFFQEHHDGNLMMGSLSFLVFFSERMDELLGLTYEQLPSKASGLSYSVMRQAYLSRDTRDALKLARRHPEFRYWVTEAGHQLDLERVIESGGLVVYALDPQSRMR